MNKDESDLEWELQPEQMAEAERSGAFTTRQALKRSKDKLTADEEAKRAEEVREKAANDRKH